MTPDQLDLLRKAQSSLQAAGVLLDSGYPDFAASRAYYAMFFVAETFLEGKGLAFSKHSAVIAAFGQHFVRTGEVPSDFHGYLVKAQEARHAGDYGVLHSVTTEQAELQILRAKQFLALAEQQLGPVPPDEQGLSLAQ